MSEIKSVHKFYTQIFTYPEIPKVFVEKAYTQLIDPPFHTGVGIAFRVPFTKKALVLGVWVNTLDEGTALTHAIGGRMLPIDDSPTWDHIRSGE
jgi:hypothetical protein